MTVEAVATDTDLISTKVDMLNKDVKELVLLLQSQVEKNVRIV